MNQDRRWKKVTEHVIFEHPRMQIREDEVIQPDGQPGKYAVARYNDAVFVVAVARDGSMVMIRQHRYPVDKVLLEVVAGQLPKGADPIEHAATELREEANLVAGKIELLGIYHEGPARRMDTAYAVLATDFDFSDSHSYNQEGDESILEVISYSQAEVRELIANGKVEDGNTLAALNLYWSKYGFPEKSS